MKINFVEDILIIDDLFEPEEISYLENWALNLDTYKLTSDITKTTVTFATQMSMDNIVIKQILEKFQENFNFEIPVFNRAILNLFRQMDFCDTHKDADYDYGVSFLIYLNSEWDISWGGDTYYFKNENPDFTISIIPKPGRVVISPTYMYHGSRPPTCLMKSIGRLTLVFQYAGDYGDIDIHEILKSFMENDDAEI
jgi:hypothetical protein